MPSGMPSGTGAFGSGIPSSATLASTQTSSTSTSVYAEAETSSSSTTSSDLPYGTGAGAPKGTGAGTPQGTGAPQAPVMYDGATPVVKDSQKAKQTEKSSCNAGN
ncbi:hypothetical protein BROUX41_005928 [Berkeleyomyces rouxiae]